VRRSRLLLVAFAVVVTVYGTAVAHGHTTRASKRSAMTTWPTAMFPSSAPTTANDNTTIARPDNVAHDGYAWYVHPAPTGRIMLAVRRSASPTPASASRPAVVLDDTSGGFNPDYLTFGDELVARGFDVVVGCLYSPPAPLDPGSGRVPCADAPQFDGVLGSMVRDLDGLVDAAYDALGPSAALAVMGFSRGAGVESARAAAGRLEPVLLASGRYEGWYANAQPDSPLVNIRDNLENWFAPALILHGTADGAVPVAQAYALEAALRAAHADVESHYYDGSGHNLSGEPGVHDDLVQRTTGFLCVRFECSP
jgi:dienelactone hydrolase